MTISKKLPKKLLLKQGSIYPDGSLDSIFTLIKQCISKYQSDEQDYPVLKVEKNTKEIYFHKIDLEDGYVFGELVLQQPGKNHEATVTKKIKNSKLERKEKVSVSAKSAVGDDTAEFTEGSLWFLCDEDHIIVLQSARLRTTRLEEYLSFIFQKCKLIENKEMVQLGNGMSPNIKSLLLNDHVEEIFISDNLRYSEVTDMDNNTRYLTNMIGSNDITSSVTDINNIVYEVKLKLPKRKMEFGQEVFDLMSHSLKDLGYNKMWVKLRNHGKISGNDLFATHECQIKARDGVLRTSYVKESMINWYKQIVSEI